MELTGAFIVAPVRCAPPANKPTPAEGILNCRPFFDGELNLLPARVWLTLGSIAWDAALGALERRGRRCPVRYRASATERSWRWTERPRCWAAST